MASCLTGSALTCQVDANALRCSAPLQGIFLLPLEYPRIPYSDQPSSSFPSTTFPKSSFLAVGILMLANDTKIFREIKTLRDAFSLQKDRGKPATWSQSSGLLFNEANCKAQHITRKTSRFDNTALELYAAEKDLDVWITKDLTWHKQVNEQSSRANKLLGYLKRNTREPK